MKPAKRSSQPPDRPAPCRSGRSIHTAARVRHRRHDAAPGQRRQVDVHEVRRHRRQHDEQRRRQPAPAAASIVPGSSLPACAPGASRPASARARCTARPENTAVALRRAPSACSASSRRTSAATTPGSRRRCRAAAATSAACGHRWDRRRRRQAKDRPRDRRPATAISGTAMRSARRPRAGRQRRRPSTTTPSDRPPRRARRAAAGSIRARDRGRNHVVDGDPREVGDEEHAATRCAPRMPERRAGRDHRRHAEARADRRERGHHRRPEHAPRPTARNIREAGSAGRARRRPAGSWRRCWRRRRAGTDPSPTGCGPRRDRGEIGGVHVDVRG